MKFLVLQIVIAILVLSWISVNIITRTVKNIKLFRAIDEIISYDAKSNKADSYSYPIPSVSTVSIIKFLSNIGSCKLIKRKIEKNSDMWGDFEYTESKLKFDDNFDTIDSMIDSDFEFIENSMVDPNINFPKDSVDSGLEPKEDIEILSSYRNEVLYFYTYTSRIVDLFNVIILKIVDVACCQKVINEKNKHVGSQRNYTFYFNEDDKEFEYFIETYHKNVKKCLSDLIVTKKEWLHVL
ncbi:hypothetical protein PAEPH01_0604 [Pancytospora epiphaga]|nr:hypothetical protein PAEPH01_0604 [Pancytospora epiphaga]